MHYVSKPAAGRFGGGRCRQPPRFFQTRQNCRQVLGAKPGRLALNWPVSGSPDPRRVRADLGGVERELREIRQDQKEIRDDRRNLRSARRGLFGPGACAGAQGIAPALPNGRGHADHALKHPEQEACDNSTGRTLTCQRKRHEDGYRTLARGSDVPDHQCRRKLGRRRDARMVRETQGHDPLPYDVRSCDPTQMRPPH